MHVYVGDVPAAAALHPGICQSEKWRFPDYVIVCYGCGQPADKERTDEDWNAMEAATFVVAQGLVQQKWQARTLVAFG